MAAVVFALGGAARAQAPPSPSAPSLQIAEAALSQVEQELRFALHLNRPLPVAELRPRLGRAVCLVLSPDRRSRRRACVSTREGHLHATLVPIDAAGAAVAPTRALRGARIEVNGGYLTLQAPAEALGVTLGDAVPWRAYVQWRDGSGCAQVPEPGSCTQSVPASGVRMLATTAPARPGFALQHRLRLLATGDSMIQIVDGDLAQRLQGRRGTTVRSDAHVGSGLTKPGELDWLRKARGQASGYKPDVTVVFLGANDGYPLNSTRCCGPAWVKAYEARVEQMMRSYLRGGRSYVYWLTLPTPRPASFARVFGRINLAIRRAAARVGDGVQVVDLASVLTPGGQFRQTVMFRGQTIDARQEDGIHLSYGGASVAATLVIERLRADDVLP